MTGPTVAEHLAGVEPTDVDAPAEADDAGRSRGGRTWAWIVDHRWAVGVGVIALAAGIALRVWILSTALGGADLDESTVGIQARQFLHGDPSTFFLKQPYGGTFETGLVAVSLRVFGMNVIALKLVPMLLALVAAVIARAAAVELELNRTGQWAVPVLVWCGPAYAVLFSTKERGFYGVALALAAAYLLLVLRLARRSSVVDVLVLGACVGLGWWQTPLTMLVAVPAVLWLVCVHPRRIVALLWAIPTALLAASPWIAWNVGHDFASIHTASSFGTTYGDRLFDWLLRMQVVLGINTPFDPDRQLVAFRWLGLILLVVIVVVATLRTRAQAPFLLAAVVVGYGLLYPVNTLSAGVGSDPRYTYLMVPVVALCIGSLLPDVDRDWQRASIVLGVGALAVTSSIWGLVGTKAQADRTHPNQFLASPGIAEVADRLEERGVTAFISDTAGMQVAFLTDQRVIGTSIAVPRSDDFERRGREGDPSTYVLEDGPLENADRLRVWLTENDIGFEEQKIGKWYVFFVDRKVPSPGPPLVAYFLQVDKPIKGTKRAGN